MLALEDLKGYTEDEVKAYLVNSWTADESLVKDFTILVAYVSVGSWGCDSSGFFLFRGPDGELYEVHGSHCSCHGFEDQFSPEYTTRADLIRRIDNSYNHSVFHTGGYDTDTQNNIDAVNQYILSLSE